MGSEGLSHRFAAEDPTFNEKSSKDDGKKSSSNHSLTHTSGTHPVSVSNGPSSSSASSSTVKSKQKSNSKYSKLFKLYQRQLSHIGTSLDAIESFSKSSNNDENKVLLSIRQRVDELNENIKNQRNAPLGKDHTYFDQMKHNIERIADDLKSYKMNDDNPRSTNTVDHLVSFPLDVSDCEEDGEKTLMYF